MLLDSNPHLLSAKTLDYPLGCRGIWLISFRWVIVQQSKAHFLRRFTKAEWKVIEYSYVSGQFWQTILGYSKTTDSLDFFSIIYCNKTNYY